MPLTRYPNGITVNSTTSLAYNSAAGNGDIDCNNIYIAGQGSITGSITAATVSASSVLVGAYGSVYGSKVSLAFVGTAGGDGLYCAALTSALYVTAATARIVAPFKCVAEIVWVSGGTANTTINIRVTESSISTGATVATLTIGSATTAANTVYTAIGGTSIAQGSDFCITSAVMATANSSKLMVNLIPVA